MLRRRLPSVLLAILLSLAGVVVAHSQTITPLPTGSTLNGTIKKSEVRNFTFEMGDDQFAELIFEWQGIDLGVAVYDSSDKPLLLAPIPVTAPGPVSVLLKLEKSQSYKLQVTTPVTQNISGNYKVLLETKPAPTLADESRIEAQNLILAARNSKSLPDQVEKYQQALLQARNAHHPDTEAQIFLMLGNAYRTARDQKLIEQDTKLPEENYQNAVSLWKQSGYKRGEAYANIRLGALYLQRRPDTAIPFYTEAARLFDEIGDRRGRAEALYFQGFSVLRLGRTSEAIGILNTVLELRRAEADRLGQANALNILGDAYRTVGEFDKALQTLDEASKAAANLEHPALEVGIASNTALVHDDLSQWESAKAAYLNALTVYERVLGASLATACYTTPAPEKQSLCGNAANVITNLGEIYNSLGKPAEALVEFKKSLTIGDALANPLMQAESLTHVGYAYYLLEDFAAALTHYEKALTIQREQNNDKGIATVLTYMGMAYIALRDPKVALEKYQAALPLMEKKNIKDKRLLAILLDKLGTNHTLLGNRADAAVAHQRALDLWRYIKDPDGEALTLYHMAEAERDAGNLVTGIQYSEAAIKQVESLRTRIANEHFRVSYRADKQGYYELDIDLRMQLGKLKSDSNAIAAALQSNEKARARTLLDALQDSVSRQAKATEGTNKEIAALFKSREDLVNLLAVRARQRTGLLGSNKEASDELPALDREIDKLTEKLGDIDAQIRKKKPRLAELTSPQPATVAEIQQQLDADTIMLELALGEKRSYAWTVTPQSVQGYELAPRSQIEDAANHLLHALNSQKRLEEDETASQLKARLANAEKEFAEAAALLRRMVLDPVAQQLDHKRLVIVADGRLQLVPFAVLPDPKNPTAKLIENYEIVTLPSASVLALQRRELANRKPAQRSVAVIADPVFDSDDDRVVELVSRTKKGKRKQVPGNPGIASQSSPAAKDEVVLQSALRDVGLDPNTLGRLSKSGDEAKEIFKLVSPDEALPAIGFDANREMVMSGKLDQYRNVHFATHGVMDLEHPELSGIVLSRFDEKGR